MSNKHIIAAFIVTPILAVMGYWVADKMVGEVPQAAQVGRNYPLVAASNCRYNSGYCELRNNDFSAQLSVTQVAGEPVLLLSSEHTLTQVLISEALLDGVESAPQAMEYHSGRQRWEAVLRVPPSASTQLRVVLNAGGAHFYAETPMVFAE